MCLAVPMKIIKIEGDFAEVRVQGLHRRVNIQMLTSPKTGDYILVHAGFAIQKIDPKKAGQTLKLINEIR